eukprot:COSAG04_NODE_441_length_14395_cov_27.067711_3_plen_268_part_00
MDVNIVEDLPSLQAGSGWSAWYQANVIDAACTCPTLSLNHDQLEALRSPSVIPGAQTCGATYETACNGASCDNAARASSGTSTCGSGISPPTNGGQCAPAPPPGSAADDDDDESGGSGWMILVIICLAAGGVVAYCSTLSEKKKKGRPSTKEQVEAELAAVRQQQQDLELYDVRAKMDGETRDAATAVAKVTVATAEEGTPTERAADPEAAPMAVAVAVAAPIATATYGGPAATERATEQAPEHSGGGGAAAEYGAPEGGAAAEYGA